MTPVRRYMKFSAKPLVAIIYLLLFSIQFNSRYFSIASYFDYAGSSKIKTASASHVLAAGRSEHAAVYSSNIPNKAHLGIDKRYQGKRIIAICPSLFRLQLAEYQESCIVFCSTDPEIVSVDSVITSLRGPPCA
jgi:hypothetical protein